MEKINKMERSKQEQNIIRIVKGSLFAIILTFIFLFIFFFLLLSVQGLCTRTGNRRRPGGI